MMDMEAKAVICQMIMSARLVPLIQTLFTTYYEYMKRRNMIFLKFKIFILIQYRPCDVFGYCTNTIGGYFCSCREGYTGDGKECRDIDECKDPELASLCVENAECCNLPAHFVCKCNEGFEGDGTKECRGKIKKEIDAAKM